MTWNRYFPCWLVVSALGVPLALIVLAASPHGTNFVYVMMGMPFLLLVWAGAGMGAAVFGVHAAMRKAWWQSLIALVCRSCWFWLSCRISFALFCSATTQG